MTPEEIIEHEANQFAIELLMPRKWLLSDLKKMGGIDIQDDAAITKLAKRYKVSLQLMTLRIGQLIPSIRREFTRDESQQR